MWTFLLVPVLIGLFAAVCRNRCMNEVNREINRSHSRVFEYMEALHRGGVDGRNAKLLKRVYGEEQGDHIFLRRARVLDALLRSVPQSEVK